MEIMLEKAEFTQKDILYRLLQYSLFEESISDNNQMNEEALFAYPWFESYFTESERAAYFIKERDSGRLLGFAMINAHTQKFDSGYSIAEFMVIPGFRRNKIGQKAAVMCFDMHRANWEVAPSYGSEQAYVFWKSVLEEYTGKDYQYTDGLFLFSNCEREI